jgi:hypothetical protein
LVVAGWAGAGGGQGTCLPCPSIIVSWARTGRVRRATLTPTSAFPAQPQHVDSPLLRLRSTSIQKPLSIKLFWQLVRRSLFDRFSASTFYMPVFRSLRQADSSQVKQGLPELRHSLRDKTQTACRMRLPIVVARPRPHLRLVQQYWRIQAAEGAQGTETKLISPSLTVALDWQGATVIFGPWLFLLAANSEPRQASTSIRGPSHDRHPVKRSNHSKHRTSDKRPATLPPPCLFDSLHLVHSPHGRPTDWLSCVRPWAARPPCSMLHAPRPDK